MASAGGVAHVHLLDQDTQSPADDAQFGTQPEPQSLPASNIADLPTQEFQVPNLIFEVPALDGPPAADDDTGNQEPDWKPGVSVPTGPTPHAARSFRSGRDMKHWLRSHSRSRSRSPGFRDELSETVKLELFRNEFLGGFPVLAEFLPALAHEGEIAVVKADIVFAGQTIRAHIPIQAMHMQWMKWSAHPKDQDPEMLLRSSPLRARAKPGQATSSMITSALAGLDGSEQVYSSQEHPDSSEPPLVGSQSQAGP